MGTRLITPPAAEPFDLVAAKLHLRLDADFAAQDSELTEMIAAAREAFEDFSQSAVITQTHQLTLCAFPSWAIRIPRPPLQSVTHIKYRDASGTLVTLDPELYQVATDRRPGLVIPAPGKSWPATQTERVEAVEIEFVCGFGDVDDDPFPVPPKAMRAMKMALTDLYEFPGSISDWKQEADGRFEGIGWDYST